MKKDKELFVYVSAWAARGGSPGLGMFTLNGETGELTFVKQINEDVSFGNFFTQPDINRLYLCNEDDLSGELGYSSGRLYQYEVEPQSGDLEEISKTETLCANPTGMCTDMSGKYMVVSNHSTPGGFTSEIAKDESGKYYPAVHYNEAVVELFSLDEDGKPDRLLDVARHGSSRDNHVNSVARAPGENLFAACDKGDGNLYMYRLDTENEKLVLVNKVSTIGQGGHPRVCVFHPDPETPLLFVNHEAALNGRMEVCAFSYTSDGGLTKAFTRNTLPAEYPLVENKLEQQGMSIHPKGMALYTVQHGNNAICVLGVDPFTGALCILQNISVPGMWPRGCAVSSDGRWLGVACRNSDEVFIYKIELDGKLSGPVSSGKLKGAASLTFYDTAEGR